MIAWCTGTAHAGAEKQEGPVTIYVPEQPGPQFWVGTSDGFPAFVGVRFPADFPGIDIETTQRVVRGEAEQTEAHFGMRYYAMPLEDDEELFASPAEVNASGIFRPL